MHRLGVVEELVAPAIVKEYKIENFTWSFQDGLDSD
jgi:hypothetical protein